MNTIKDILTTALGIGVLILFIIIAFTVKFTVIGLLIFFFIAYSIYLAIVTRED